MGQFLTLSCFKLLRKITIIYIKNMSVVVSLWQHVLHSIKKSSIDQLFHIPSVVSINKNEFPHNDAIRRIWFGSCLFLLGLFSVMFCRINL